MSAIYHYAILLSHRLLHIVMSLFSMRDIAGAKELLMMPRASYALARADNTRYGRCAILFATIG